MPNALNGGWFITGEELRPRMREISAHSLAAGAGVARSLSLVGNARSRELYCNDIASKLVRLAG